MKNLSKKLMSTGLMLILALAIILAGCGKMETVGSDKQKLVVYYVRDHIYYGDVLGEFCLKYDKKYDITLVPFETDELLNTQLKTEIAAGRGPDVVLITADSQFDIYKAVNSRNLQNLSSFMEKDLSFDEEDYYMSVVNGGKYLGEQYVLPFSFTLDVLYLNQNATDNLDTSETVTGNFESMVKLLSKMQSTISNDIFSVIYTSQILNMNLIERYLVNSGIDFVSENGEIGEDINSFTLLVKYLKEYVEENNIKRELNVNNTQIIFDKAVSSSMSGNFILGYLMAEALYNEIEQQTSLTVIPWKNIEGKIQPIVVDYGFVTANSNNKEAAYNLLRYIMNYDITLGIYSPLSVCRQNINENLDYLSINTVPAAKLANGTDVMTETIKDEQRSLILNTLDNMDTAVIYNTGYYDIIREYINDCIMRANSDIDIKELAGSIQRYLGE